MVCISINFYELTIIIFQKIILQPQTVLSFLRKIETQKTKLTKVDIGQRTSKFSNRK